MAIPVGTKFIGIRPGVDLSERKSAFINDLTEAYEVGDFTGTFTGTTDDITEGVTNLFVTQSEKNLWNNGPHTVGTSGQIPFVNGTDDDLSYTNNLTWNGTSLIAGAEGSVGVHQFYNQVLVRNDGSSLGSVTLNGDLGYIRIYDLTNADTLYIYGDKIGYTVTPTAYFHAPPATTSKASIRVELGESPTIPNSGDLWFTGTNFNFYNGTNTIDLLGYYNSLGTSGQIPFVNGTDDDLSYSSNLTYNGNLNIDTGRFIATLDSASFVRLGQLENNTQEALYVKGFANKRYIAYFQNNNGNAYFGVAGRGGTVPATFTMDAQASDRTTTLLVKGSGSTSATTTFLLQNASGTDLLKVDDSGQVGIGTASPTARLQVKGSGSTSATTNFLLQNSSGTDLLKVTDDGAINFTTSATNGYFLNFNNSTYRFQSLSTSGYTTSFMNDNVGFNINVGSASRNISFSISNNKYLTIDTSGNVGIGTTSPNASAKLQIDSTTQGFLPPRMTTTEKNAIATPATGLLVYDTDEGVYNYFDGVSWTTMGLSLWQESGTNIYYDAGSVGVNTGGVNDAKFHVNGDGDNDSTVSFVVKSSLGNERFKVQDGGRFVHSSSSGSFIGYDDSIGNYKLNIKGTSGHGSYIWANGSNSLSIGNNGDIFIGRQNGTSGPLSFSSVIFDNVWGRLIIGDTDTTRNGNLRVRSGSNSTETINSVFTDNSENELMKILATGVVTVGYQGTTSSTSTLTTYANTLSTAKFVSTAASGASSGSDIAAVSDDGAAIASGDRLGGLLIGGSSDASHNLRSAVGVTGYATELWSGTQNGAKLNFEVTPNGYTSRSVAMTIDQNLNVGIGETSPLPIWGSGRVLCIKDVVNDEVEINFKTTTHSAMMSLGESVSGSYFTIGTDTLADFRISTNTTNRFAISSTGESAFNLANPSEATLQVNTHSDSKIAFLVTGSATASQDVFEVRVGTSKELAVKSSGVLYYNQTPVESQATDSTHKVEVDLGGSTYYFLVTNV